MGTTVATGRLIRWGSYAGSTNMAIDQMLLETAGTNPTLRFYGWTVPTLSLGYFQSVIERESHAASRSLPLVRRASGGGAIIHHHELTYSLISPIQWLSRQTISGRSLGAFQFLYDVVHRNVIAVLSGFGVSAHLFRHSNHKTSSDPFLCFQRRARGDVIVGGYKVLGSAQRRSQHAILQHGSLLLRPSSYAPELPGVESFASQTIDFDSLLDAIASKLASELTLSWQNEPLRTDEFTQAAGIEATRFGTNEWTVKR